jgi:copper chaperone CopZ
MSKLVMIRTLAALVVGTALSVSVAFACPGPADAKDAPKQEEKQAKKLATATFRVKGMECEGCGAKVKKVLGGTDGIVKVVVQIADKRVVVDYDADKLDTAKIAKIITELGYTATAET